MPLTPCRECGHEISSEALACPKCGAPPLPPKEPEQPPVKKAKNNPLGVAFLIVIFTIGGYVALFGEKKPPAPPSPAPVAAPTPKPVELTPEQKAAKALEEKRSDSTVKAALHIRSGLRNPDSLKWEVIKASDDGNIVCMGYRAQNGFGGMNREQAVVVGTKISSTPENVKKHCQSGRFVDMKDYVEQILPLL